MSQQYPVDLLVDATVTGTTYRKLFNYDITNISDLRGLKLRVLEDLKEAGAPVETQTSEVVLRNYMLTDYERTLFNSAGAKTCALSDKDSWSAGPGNCCRLLAAVSSPQIPIGPADESRHAMLAVASCQFYDRSLGGGSVLPLEARVKPLAPPGHNASEGTTPAAQPSKPDDASTAVGSSSAPAPGGSTSTESEAFDITVRDFRGRCHMVRVCGATSVSRLKTGIAAALGCSVVSHWRLMYGGRPLDDGLDLADYSISAGALVEVQMTSQQHQQQIRGKAGGISSLMTSDGSKDAATGGSTAKATGAAAAAAAHSGAVWGNPVAKGAAPSQMAVQVKREGKQRTSPHKPSHRSPRPLRTCVGGE
ncbi:hypothetical protein Vretimale_11288 [Volvox reticuliferus]|uniref:Ubiquitin-like domain-containing protein n=1 Tax=Volvox reticuliferus TaxID=1737510 RepID=A0A8J4GHK9_9CHLO|nr:hypothetical protein Vretifemale_12059 [Volvox reticuliferus]GIM07203.1 hypothetical protein Vretimale_11288 [Volvox reticuliferus]